jgi:hypothetical protein
MTTYLVELVQVNRIIKVKARSEDYDRANDVYDAVKKQQCREARLLKLHNGERVLLKYVNRGNNRSRY